MRVDQAEPRPPSGAQHRIVHGDQEAVVVEVGGGVRTYRAGGAEVIDGYGAEEIRPGGAGQVMVPWPNRLADGRYAFEGRAYQLSLSEPARSNAIHGLARWDSWALADHGDGWAELVHVLNARSGYPFALESRVRWSLGRDGLRADHVVRNIGAEPAPVGLGAHPYLLIPGVAVDELTLTVPADTVLDTNEAGIPTGRRPVGDTSFDFRRGRRIGPAVIDHGFADLRAGDDGIVRIRLEGGGAARTLWFTTPFRYAQVFSADTLARPRRRRAVAVEPMTCPSNALASGEGVEVLPPGGELSASWGITPA